MKPHNNPAIIAPISQMRKLKLCDLSLRLSGGAQIQTQAVYLKSPGVYPWSNLPPAQVTEVWNKFLTSGMAFKAFPNLDTTAFGNTAPSPFPSSNHCALHASQSPIHSAFLLFNTLVHALLSSVTSLAPPCPIKTDTASFRALFKCPYPWAPFLPQAVLLTHNTIYAELVCASFIFIIPYYHWAGCTPVCLWLKRSLKEGPVLPFNFTTRHNTSHITADE